MRPGLSLIVCLFLSFFRWSYAQMPPVTKPRPVLSADARDETSFFHKILEQSNQRQQPTVGPIKGQVKGVEKPGRLIRTSARPLGAPSCIDTTAHILTTEAPDVLGVDFITKTRDGNVLAPGFRYSVTPPYYQSPYLVKYTPQGDIVWARSFDGLGSYPIDRAYAYICFELNDGSLLLIGEVDIPEAFNGRQELAMWKLDAGGNLLWAQTDSCTIWEQYSGGLQVMDFVQDGVGNIYLAGNQRATDAISTHTFVLKMDPGGNIIWDKSFAARASSCYGLMWTGNELSLIASNQGGTNFVWCLKLDPATGDTIRSRAWIPDYGANSSWYAITTVGKACQLANGNIAVYGPVLNDLGQIIDPQVHGAVAEFDQSFNFIRGWMLRSNAKSNYYNTVLTEHPSGRISYTYMTYANSYDEDILYGAIEQGQIIKERLVQQRNRSSAWTSNFVYFPGNEDILVQYFGDPIRNITGQEFIRLHDSDTSSVCSGRDTAISWLEPYVMTPMPYYRWESIASNTFRKTARPMPPPVDRSPPQETACKVPSFCTSLQLSADLDKVCAGTPVVFTCRRNPECGSRPTWVFDTTNLQSYSIPDDSTLWLVYRDQFKGNVSATMNGTCSNLSDFKLLTVTAADKPVVLGADAYLCPDSALILRPAKGYSTYTWQDGSVEDTLLVTAPGQYYITVTNTCGSPSSDTVLVDQDPSALSFSVGSDVSVCLDDAATLRAPDGYDQYSWKDLNNGYIYQTQSLTVQPTVNTRYFAAAKTPLGCPVKAMIAVNVDRPLPMDLGKDISLCKGDSILLNAGSGFLNYTWSTGATSAIIYGHQQGAYSVKAQSPNGCFSKDTLLVLQLYPLPAVKLDKETWLCEGVSRSLDAPSGYAAYQWQDGSSA
ncbi:MAG TPA: hypothetical protein VHC48_11970, partial [Puia sp.]|nr:hypothetical protein [Puia sp.]